MTDADSPNWRHTSTKERTKTNTKKKKVVVLPFDSKEFSVAWQSWKDYKRDEHGFKFKSPASEQASLHQLQNLSGGNEETAVRIIKSLANGWRGFFPLKTNTMKAEQTVALQMAHSLKRISEGSPMSPAKAWAEGTNVSRRTASTPPAPRRHF